MFKRKHKFMNETEPLVVLRRYHAILLSALIVEVISFVVSLTDTIIAGNIVGESAFAAVSLVAPLFTISIFITAVINSGTVINYL